MTPLLMLASLCAAELPPEPPAAPVTVVVAAPTVLGITDAELTLLQRRVQDAVAGAGVAVLAVPSVAAECVDDAACVAARVVGGAALVVVDASVVGSDVEVDDAVYDRTGRRVAGAHRALTRVEFDAAPLSSETVGAVRAMAPPADVVSAAPSPAAPSLVAPSVLAVGAGTVVGVAGLAGFAVEAATLQDARSLGSDKERARVTSWVFLGAAAAGVGGAVAGALLLPGPDGG